MPLEREGVPVLSDRQRRRELGRFVAAVAALDEDVRRPQNRAERRAQERAAARALKRHLPR